MSNESIPDCIVHKDSRNIQTRLDYMLLFRNETKAKIIRIMETWTNQKRAEWYKSQTEQKELEQEPPEEALWVTMSYEEFSIFAYGTMNHDNIKKHVDDLVTQEYMKRRPNPLPGYALQYLLDTKLLQEGLDNQDIPSLFEDIGKIRPPRKKHTPPEKYPRGEGINTPRVGVKIPPGDGVKIGTSNNTTKNYKESTKNRGTLVNSSDEEIDAPAPINFETKKEEKRTTNPSMPAIPVANDSKKEQEEEDEGEPTAKHTAIPKQTTSSISESLSPPTNPMQRSGVSPGTSASTDAAQHGMAMTPKQIQRELEKRVDEILLLYGQKIGRKPSRSKANLDGALKLAQEEVSDRDIGTTIDAILADSFMAKNLTLTFVHSKLDALARQPEPIPIDKKKDPNIGVSGLPRLPDLRDKYHLGEKYG